VRWADRRVGAAQPPEPTIGHPQRLVDRDTSGQQRLGGGGHHRLDTVGGTVASHHDADTAGCGQLRDHQVQSGVHRPKRFIGAGQIQPGAHDNAAATVVDSEQDQAGVGLEAQQERDQGEQVHGAADAHGGSIGGRHRDSFG